MLPIPSPRVTRPFAAIALLAALATVARAQVHGALTLADAVALATRQAPAAQVAALKAREAEARVGQARGALLPQVTGTASQIDRTSNLTTSGLPLSPQLGFPTKIGPYQVMDARLAVRQPVVDFSSWKRVGAARAAVAGAQADADAATEQAAVTAALAYLRTTRAQAIVAAREQDVSLSGDLLSLAELQQRAGTSPAIDTTRARTQLVAAQGALLLARNAADKARVDLARALGVDPGAVPAIGDTLAETLGASDAPGDSAASATAYARSHRPELTAERTKLTRARAERSAIAAEILPRLDAVADWGVSGTHWNEVFPTREYGASLTMPVLDGGRREARVAEQRSVERESEVRLHDLDDAIAADVDAAFLDVASGRDQLHVAEERVALAEAEVAQARERFASGVAGNIEVIDAQASLIRAHDALIDARFTIAAGRVAIARAAGVARTLH